MSTKLKISHNKLILVEGADAYWFLIWALKAYSIEDVQVKIGRASCRERV